MPFMTVSIALIAPLGLALYWFISNILSIAERGVKKQVFFFFSLFLEKNNEIHQIPCFAIDFFYAFCYNERY
jgi:hypothetical protein